MSLYAVELAQRPQAQLSLRRLLGGGVVECINVEAKGRHIAKVGRYGEASHTLERTRELTAMQISMVNARLTMSIFAQPKEKGDRSACTWPQRALHCTLPNRAPMECERMDLDYLDAKQLGQLAGAVVLAVGMTPDVRVAVPDPAEGCSWRECYERGLERLSRSVNLR